MNLTIQQCQQLEAIHSGGKITPSKLNKLVDKGLVSMKEYLASSNRKAVENYELTEIGVLALAQFNKLAHRFPVK